MSDPNRENITPDVQVDKTINKLADQYAACDRRSKEINDERKEIRDNAEKLGIPSKAFQHAVGMVKNMTPGERSDYERGMRRVLGVISDRQDELFPMEAERMRKREAASKPTGKEGAPDPDANPRSDPASGGAGKGKAKAKPAAPAPDPAANDDAEQKAGEEALARVDRLNKDFPAGGNGEPPEPPAIVDPVKSQSAIAADKRAAAKLN